MGFARQVLSSRVPGDAIRVLPAPGFGPRRVNPSTSCLGLAVPAQSNTPPEAAWALVEWLALGEPASQRFASGQGLPASRAAVQGAARETKQQVPWQQQLAELVLKEVSKTQALCIQTSPYLDGDLLAQAWRRQEERFLTGQLNLDEMLAAVEAEARLATLSKTDSFS